jgi:hypothetical protein
MAPRIDKMKALRGLIEEKVEQRKQLDTEIKALEEAYRVMSGEPKQAKRTTTNVKQVLLDLLEAVGTKGLDAATAVAMAKANGDDLKRGTVSSLLSRLKADTAVWYDGHVYRLTKFPPQPTAQPQAQAAVTQPLTTMRPPPQSSRVAHPPHPNIINHPASGSAS